MNDLVKVERDVRVWAAAFYGPGVEVNDLHRMPGNSGVSFGFTVERPGDIAVKLVARLAPPGVPARGSTDVLRQVPILEELEHSGIPVPPVRFASADPQWFGTDVVIMDRMCGSTFPLHDGNMKWYGESPPIEVMLREAAAILSAIHDVRWQDRLSNWSAPLAPSEAVTQWDGLVEKGGVPEWIPEAKRVRTQLLETAPSDGRIGVFHGDYHTNNLLFRRSGHITAVLDWEISGIGPTEMDIAWMTMWMDTRCWSREFGAKLSVRASDTFVLKLYEEAIGTSVQHFEWYFALACYKYATIAAYNLRLHRRGRRIDPWYETVASSIPHLQARALGLVSA